MKKALRILKIFSTLFARVPRPNAQYGVRDTCEPEQGDSVFVSADSVAPVVLTAATPLELLGKEGNFPAENADRLDSWKEIASYLNRNVRTVQRWEALESMPVHRHFHAKSGSVHAFRPELDAWRNQRIDCHPRGGDQTRSTQCSETDLINHKEQALLRSVLEAILVQLATRTASAASVVRVRDASYKIVRSLVSLKAPDDFK